MEPAVCVLGPRWARSAIEVWPIVAVVSLGRLVWRLVWGDPGPNASELVVVVGLFLVSGLVVWRTARLAVIADGDRLVVRNWLRNVTLLRGDIAAIELTADGVPASVFVVLHDGRRVGLEALGSRTRPERRQERVDALQHWLAVAPIRG